MLFSLILVSSFISFAHSDCLFYTDKQIGNACFTFVNEKLSFWDAEQYCNRRLQNGVWSNLAKVENTIESNFVAANARTEFSMNYGEFWIGCYRPTVYDSFKYMDGRPCSYNNFANANPSMNFATESVANAKWFTQPEEKLLPFVCSYYPPTEGSTSRATEGSTSGTTEGSTSGTTEDLTTRREATPGTTETAGTTGFPTTSGYWK